MNLSYGQNVGILATTKVDLSRYDMLMPWDRIDLIRRHSRIYSPGVVALQLRGDSVGNVWPG